MSDIPEDVMKAADEAYGDAVRGGHDTRSYESRIIVIARATLDHWRHEVGKLHSRIATKDEQIARLKAAINWCIECDDRNGSLPESYREKLLSVLE